MAGRAAMPRLMSGFNIKKVYITDFHILALSEFTLVFTVNSHCKLIGLRLS